MKARSFHHQLQIGQNVRRANICHFVEVYKQETILSNNQAESNEKGLKILGIRKEGPIITQLYNQTILESEGKSLTGSNKKTRLPIQSRTFNG